MDVRLRRTWFAPDISGNTSDRYVSKLGRVVARGHRLRKGVHRGLPDEWRDKLPKDAVVLKEPEDYDLEDDEREHDEVVSLANRTDDRSKEDLSLAAAEHAQRLLEEAEADKAAQVKEQRIANLTKARKAKKEKKDDA